MRLECDFSSSVTPRGSFAETPKVRTKMISLVLKYIQVKTKETKAKYFSLYNLPSRERSKVEPNDERRQCVCDDQPVERGGQQELSSAQRILEPGII